MIGKIEELRKEIEQLSAQTADEVEVLRIKYISKKGLVPALFNDFKNVPAEQKRELGVKLNDLKQMASEKIKQLSNEVKGQRQTEQVDLTRPGVPYPMGSRHPLTVVKEEICNIFGRLGFSIADGPEIEDDWHVFEALNFSADHPARDMQDTFFVNHDDQILLRTHTSSVQIRAMLENNQPPIKILCPGRVYRNEAISSRAHCFFHQVEGLFIAENVSFVDLRETLLYFAQEFFGSKTQIRLRPSYFPFTEPSAEMDVSCGICYGDGCSLCKGSGWVEILGCGMVDPAVLENCGIDSSKYSGFAFGMGVERMANIKYRVSDLRYFSENQISFLEQFKGVH